MSEVHIDRKGIPPGLDQGEYPSYLCCFHHFKLDFALVILALNEWKPETNHSAGQGFRPTRK